MALSAGYLVAAVAYVSAEVVNPEGPWTRGGTVAGIIGAVFAVLAFVVIIHSAYILPKRERVQRRRELLHPITAHFIILDKKGPKSEIAFQDTEGHLTNELVLPANSERRIQIQISPTTHFHSTSILFGCQGDALEKPYATHYDNDFMLVGMHKTIDPKENPNHFITTSHFYQINRIDSWSLGNDRILGYRLKARGAGIFKAVIAFVGEEVEGTAEMTIRVEETISRHMFLRCISHENCIVKLLPSTPE